MGTGPGLAACLMDTRLVLEYQRQIGVSCGSESGMTRKQGLFREIRMAPEAGWDYSPSISIPGDGIPILSPRRPVSRKIEVKR